MNDEQDFIDVGLIAHAGDSWLASHAANKDPEEWVRDLQISWLAGGFEYLWHFILRLCETVDPNDNEIINEIGVDPLVDLVLSYPDQALAAIEDVADQQPILVQALSIVMGDSEETDSRIDAILARYGRSRE